MLPGPRHSIVGMRAIVYSEQGPSSVLRLADRPVPEPGPGQVRVRMVRAGVNPTDWKSRAGVTAPLAFPEVTPGQDGATVAVYATNGGNTFPVDIRRTFGVNLRYQFLLLYTLAPALLEAAAQDVTAAITAGALSVGEKAGLPLHHFPLAQTAAAHDAVERGAVGKVLIDIG